MLSVMLSILIWILCEYWIMWVSNISPGLNVCPKCPNTSYDWWLWVFRLIWIKLGHGTSTTLSTGVDWCRQIRSAWDSNLNFPRPLTFLLAFSSGASKYEKHWLQKLLSRLAPLLIQFSHLTVTISGDDILCRIALSTLVDSVVLVPCPSFLIYHQTISIVCINEYFLKRLS